jgi:hypothetical protein
MWSFDFGEIEELQHAGRWDDASAEIIVAAQRMERGHFVVICTNTMHRMADQVQVAIRLLLLHIADPTADRIKATGFRTAGLLGTAFTMEQDFCKGRPTERHGLEVLVPDDADRAEVHWVIYEELVQGRAEPSSPAGLSRGDRPACGAWRGCRDPRLHGDHAAGETREQRSASVRHHDDPRRGCGRSGHREVLTKPSHWMIGHGLSDPFEGRSSTKPTF